MPAPKRHPSHLSQLKRENRALITNAAELKNMLRKKETLSNGITELAQSLQFGGFQPSNLTSINPIISNNIYFPLSLDWMTLIYMYTTHGVIQTAIDMPVLDALRGGLELKSNEMDADDIKELLDFLEENEVFARMGETGTWARLFGGSGLIINVMDQDPAKPLEFKKSNAKMKFYAANRWEFGPGWRADDPYSMLQTPAAAYDAKEQERYTFYGMPLHASRVLAMSGKAAPSLLRWQLQGWGMTEVQRMVEDFNAYIKTKNVVYELMEEAMVDVYKMEGFNSALLTAQGQARIVNRVQRANQIKNFNRGLLLDKLDDYEQKQITFSGIGDIMKENRIGLASALRMPFSKLFGTTAGGGGLANSGQDDLENYNAMVESEVREKLKPIVRKLLRIVCVHLFGAEFDIDFKFKSLRVLSGAEEETVKTSKQNRTLALYDRGLYTPQEAMEELGKEQLAPTDTLAAQGLMKERPGAEGLLGGEDEEDDDEQGAEGKDKPKKKEGGDDAGGK